MPDKIGNINVFKGTDEPVWKPVGEEGIPFEDMHLRSDECLLFHKTIGSDGIHGYIKSLGVFQKLPRMESGWVSIEEDPLRVPDYWCYSLSLDNLVTESINKNRAPMYVKVVLSEDRKIALRLINGWEYYRDAGNWDCSFKYVDGQMVASSSHEGLDGKPLVSCTKKEWLEDNAGYVDEYKDKDPINLGNSERSC